MPTAGCDRYGCALQSNDSKGLCGLAQLTFKVVFDCEHPIPHILLRDYARGVVEVANARGCSLGFDLQKARPPYKSNWVDPVFKDGELEEWGKWSVENPQENIARRHLYNSIMGSSDFARTRCLRE